MGLLIYFALATVTGFSRSEARAVQQNNLYERQERWIGWKSVQPLWVAHEKML